MATIQWMYTLTSDIYGKMSLLPAPCENCGLDTNGQFDCGKCGARFCSKMCLKYSKSSPDHKKSCVPPMEPEQALDYFKQADITSSLKYGEYDLIPVPGQLPEPVPRALIHVSKLPSDFFQQVRGLAEIQRASLQYVVEVCNFYRVMEFQLNPEQKEAIKQGGIKALKSLHKFVEINPQTTKKEDYEEIP